MNTIHNMGDGGAAITCSMECQCCKEEIPPTHYITSTGCWCDQCFNGRKGDCCSEWEEGNE